MRKKLFLILAFISVALFASADGGSCGDNLTWSLSDTRYTLTISGTGPMTDWEKYYDVPWATYTTIRCVIVEEGVTSIGNFAFYSQFNLYSVSLPSTLTKIGSYAFCNCTKLKSITLPSNLTTIGDNAFDICPLTSINIPGTVTSIGERAFWGGKFTSVVIPEGVTNIGNNAFRNCSNLTSVTIPSSVLSLGQGALCDCPNLTSVTLSEGLTTIGSAAFQYDTALSSISIPSTVTEIGRWAFLKCNITSIMVPYACETIGEDAFLGIDTVYVCSEATGSPWGANTCVKFTAGKCGDNLTYIYNPLNRTLTISGTGPMWDYANSSSQPWSSIGGSVQKLVINSGVTSIGNYAFMHLNSLKKDIVFPETLKSIGDYAFSYVSLTNVTLPEGLQEIKHYAFYSCFKLKSISFPSSLKKLDGHSFYACSNLTSVTLPEGLEELDSYVFAGCTSLSSITLPSTLNEFGRGCFRNCTSLTDIYSFALVPPTTTYDDVFENVPTTATLHVPEGTEELYAVAKGWEYFSNITGPQHNVTFKNYNGVVLQVVPCAKGKIPSYTGETPKRPATAQYTYTFKGWDREIVASVAEEDYIAQYDSVVNKYVASFVNYDGTELKRDTVDYNTAATAPATAPTRAATAEYTYTFSGWDVDFSHVTADITITAQYNAVVNKYVATFVNYDGTVLKRDTVNYNTAATAPATTPTRAATAEYTYTFSGWDVDFSHVTADITITAQYNAVVNKYVASFVNYDGTVLKRDTVNYNTAATAPATTPTRAATAEYTYTFSGWDVDFSHVTADITITAQYNAVVNKYVATFVNYDGTVLKRDTVDYNTAATAPATTPTRAATAEYTYTFSGWDVDFSHVTADITITAQYNSVVNKYVASFVNYDGTVLKRDTVNYNTAATAPATTPTRAATAEYTYTFSGWDVDFSHVTADITITAQYNAVVNKYVATFVNYDGTVLKRDTVDYNTAATAPATTPTRAATAEYTYTFSGWDVDFSHVTADITVTAQYNAVVNKYVATFVNYDGTELKRDTVNYNTAATAPATAPTRAATAEYTYTFSGWDVDFSHVTADVTVTAQYDAVVNKYVATFVNYDGTVLKRDTVDYNTAATAPATTPTRAATAEYTYTFSGWDVDFSHVTADITVTAQYNAVVNKYVATFVNYDGTELKRDTVDYNTAATAPATAPTKAATAEYTYTFSGWDVDFSHVTADITVTAQYNAVVNKYVASFVNYDGTVLKRDTVNYNTAATAPATTPTRAATAEYTYTFSGWDVDFSHVTADITVTAQYNAVVNKYVATFVNYDGTELKRDTVDYNTAATAPATAPTKAATAEYTYTFSGWDVDFSHVTADITVTAQYDSVVNKYVVRFVDYDGTLLKKEEVAYGKDAVAPEDPVRPGYVFTGWDGDYTHITGDVTVTATYSISTGLNDVKAGPKAIKYFDNGQVIIQTPDGQMYQTSGRRIK